MCSNGIALTLATRECVNKEIMAVWILLEKIFLEEVGFDIAYKTWICFKEQ